MIRSYKGIRPVVPASCYVDSSAQLIGDVVLGEHAPPNSRLLIS